MANFLGHSVWPRIHSISLDRYANGKLQLLQLRSLVGC